MHYARRCSCHTYVDLSTCFNDFISGCLLSWNRVLFFFFVWIQNFCSKVLLCLLSYGTGTLFSCRNLQNNVISAITGKMFGDSQTSSTYSLWVLLYHHRSVKKADLSFEDREVDFTNCLSASQLFGGLGMSHFKSSILLLLLLTCRVIG